MLKHTISISSRLFRITTPRKKLEVVFTHVKKTEKPLLSYFLYS